jgi:hypothetical protein
MNPIHQLSDRDYKELVEKANLNEKEIEHRAFKKYEELGTHAINIKIDIQDGYDENVLLKVRSSYSDWKTKFPIKKEDRKKVLDFIDSRAYDLIYDKIGDPIEVINKYRDRKSRLGNMQNRFLAFTVTGWLVAVLLVVIYLLR